MKLRNPKPGGYYNNSHICGECTGAGCKHCIGGLSGTGYETFPLSNTINGCRPPYIQNPYAWNLHPRTAAHIILQHRINNRL